MRPTLAVLPLFLVALPLLAQGPAPAPGVPADARFSPQRNSGLRPATNGRGLFGGGADYRVHLRMEGMRYEPALGLLAPTTQHLALSPVSVRRGTAVVAQLPSFAPPAQAERMARYEHAPGVSEGYDVRPEGVELSWRFEYPLAGDGDLVVRYAIDTSLPAPTAVDGGLVFAHPEFGGVKIGGVTGIDARGAKVAGGMRYLAGALELSLPGPFVATATYPIVLDPLIGTAFGVSAGLTYADAQPDVANDAATNRFLVVWQRTFSATNTDVRGQLVSGLGLAGGTIFFGSSGVASRPRVANLGTRQRFGVAWTQLVGATSSVELECVGAVTGLITHSLTSSSSTTATYADVDIGGEPDAPVGGVAGFVLCYEDNVVDAIRARRIWFNPSDALLSNNPISVFTDTVLGSTYVKPAISRAAAADGKFLVVARRNSVLFGTSSIVAAVVTSNTSTLGPTITVYSNSSDTVSVPDVDGYASKWVVAWEQEAIGFPYSAVVAAPVSLDAPGTALIVGSSSSVGGTTLAQASVPSVGYTPGKTWLGYHNLSTLPFQPSVATLRARGIDSGTCTLGTDTLSVTDYGGQTRIVVATNTSGGQTSGDEALAVYEESFDDVYAQRLQNHSNSGSITNLGGGCGTGVVQFFPHSYNPAIGSSGCVCSVGGLPATALATIFNFAEPGVPIACGVCVWTPFSVTLSPPIVGTSASVEFPIPYLTSLAGAIFETQWTTIDFTQAPCAVFPGVVLSNRSQLTIGL